MYRFIFISEPTPPVGQLLPVPHIFTQGLPLVDKIHTALSPAPAPQLLLFSCSSSHLLLFSCSSGSPLQRLTSSRPAGGVHTAAGGEADGGQDERSELAGLRHLSVWHLAARGPEDLLLQK